MKSVRRHILVTGRVQQVGFRFFCRWLAFRMRVTGWVRNLPDGAVELEIQGPPKRVDAFLTKMHRDSGDIRVEGIELDYLDPLPDEFSFRVLR